MQWRSNGGSDPEHEETDAEERAEKVEGPSEVEGTSRVKNGNLFIPSRDKTGNQLEALSGRTESEQSM